MTRSADYYRQVAQLHIQNIDQGFLSTLGINFVSLMYRAIDEVDSSVLLTKEVDGRVIGFISGAEGMGAIYRRMLHYFPRLLLALFPVLASPRKLRRIFEILRYSRSSGAHSAADFSNVELLSIAVGPSYRGTGYSSALYGELKDYFARRGVAAFKIVVGEELGPAHKFYRRMGAQPMSTIEVHEGEKSTVYVQCLGTVNRSS
ncbi:MAG: GNAT family N-acetyltransferase [Rhodanobacter sp.]